MHCVLSQQDLPTASSKLHSLSCWQASPFESFSASLDSLHSPGSWNLFCSCHVKSPKISSCTYSFIRHPWSCSVKITSKVHTLTAHWVETPALSTCSSDQSLIAVPLCRPVSSFIHWEKGRTLVDLPWFSSRSLNQTHNLLFSWSDSLQSVACRLYQEVVSHSSAMLADCCWFVIVSCTC